MFSDDECGSIRDGIEREIGLAHFRQMVEGLIPRERTDRHTHTHRRAHTHSNTIILSLEFQTRL